MDYSNLEDFKVYFWQYIDDNIVSYEDKFIENKDFCDSVCFDCYKIYKQSNISIDILCKMAENMLFNVYRFKPILGN